MQTVPGLKRIVCCDFLAYKNHREPRGKSYCQKLFPPHTFHKMHVHAAKPIVSKSDMTCRGENTNFVFICCNCAMPRTPEHDRLRAVGMLQGGSTLSATARHFGVQRSTVSMWWTHFQNTGTTTDLPRHGRARVTSAQHWHHH